MNKRLLSAITGLAAGVAFVFAGAAPASASGRTIAYDLSRDGHYETWLVDENGNGRYELALFDQNLDGIRDGVAIDRGENGSFDLWGMDRNQNNYFEVIAADDNQDGRFDRAVWDMNENRVEDSRENSYSSYAIVGGTPTYPGLGGLLNTMARVSGQATWGSGNYDGDGCADNRDRWPGDRRYC